MAIEENVSKAWRRIADELAETIRAGTYELGSGLPTTVEIATRYNVHRHTASKALHYLREQGLVSVEQGRGSFVRGVRYPYRLNEKVSFRKNFADTGLPVTSRLLEVLTIAIPSTVAQALNLSTNSSVWRIVLLNSLTNERFPYRSIICLRKNSLTSLKNSKKVTIQSVKPFKPVAWSHISANQQKYQRALPQTKNIYALN